MYSGAPILFSFFILQIHEGHLENDTIRKSTSAILVLLALYSSKVPEQRMKDPICTEQVQYTRKHRYCNL